jgi:general stress protein YciG
MPEKNYVFDYFLFVSRRADPPKPWIWEIRRKSKPDGRYFSAEGFRSAKAAEDAGKIVLAEVRKAALEDQAAKQAALAAERDRKNARRTELDAARASRNTPERRSENARNAAKARAMALSPERRSEIARRGGAASKGKPKIGKQPRAPTDSS